jgi:hypothetical protein
MERQTKDNQEDENEEQDLDASINRFVNSPTNIIKTFDSSCYQYSEDDIEEFFFFEYGTTERTYLRRKHL